MDQAEFYKEVRLGTLDPRLPTADIDRSMIQGLIIIGQTFQAIKPDYLNKRTVLTSDRKPVFEEPASSTKIKAIWDLGEEAKDVFIVGNAAGVPRISVLDHGWETGQVVGVAGLEYLNIPNDRYVITVNDENTFDLLAITDMQGGYTAGGLVYTEDNIGGRINLIDVERATGSQSDKWYSMDLGTQIIIDSNDFTNDIVCDYEQRLTSLSDLDEDYHFALAAFCILHHLQPPDPKAPNAKLYDRNSRFYSGIWESLEGVIQRAADVARPDTQRRRNRSRYM